MLDHAAIAAAAADAPQVSQTVPLVPGLQLHVDGDYLAYYASGNDDTTPGQARQNALDRLDSFRTRVGAESIVVHNTGKGCHKGERYLIATVKPYQGQRDGGRKPKNHAYLQQWLMEYSGPLFVTKTWATREADDGIAACSHFAVGRSPGYIAIATADKDMRMLPGVHINWRGGQVTRVNPGDYDVIGEDGKQYGLKFFFLQMLMGDTADNCPGLEYAWLVSPKGERRLYSIGEKRAEALLKGTTCVQEAYDIVLKLYKESYAGLSGFALDRFCEQAALMWMRMGNDAAVADFAHHNGHSRINHNFDEDMWAAVKRLEERVINARSEINSFSNQSGS